ncbi:DUF1654 domain-containing protein [Pseudomonas sp. R5(2019)]|uniref:DUF1654 domain-containing protein n=1 Tax=Pseudomonas sp. R5(2019) TaxID=2697566 RepID=UPI0014128E1B|nr:DUF1654 domain-containing protein [Pseudomonas sp. R5(2019)]NBA95535.1 DUF1654 domain-containing protein [Pseudomonas sp. R5(2019)]
MLVQPDLTRSSPQSYEQIGHRIRSLVADPKVQRVMAVTVRRRNDENLSDWRRLIDEISETAGIHVNELEDGAVRIAWKDYCEA